MSSTLVVATAAIAAASFLPWTVAGAVEALPYRIIESDGGVEVREYPPHLVAETMVEGEFDAVGNEGFRRLASFIFGENQPQSRVAMTAPVSQQRQPEKIAMTAPVSQEPGSGGEWRITFVMPASYSRDTLPEPLDERIIIREVPARLFAALRYSGSWSESRYRDREAQLLAWMAQRGLEPDGAPVFARYNPPFMPWFLRRNEVLIPFRRDQAVN